MRALFGCGTPKDAADAQNDVVQADDACAIIIAAVIGGQPALVVAAVAPESAI